MSINRNSPENESSLSDLSPDAAEAISPDLNAMQTEMTKMREDIKGLQDQNAIVLKKNAELKKMIQNLREDLSTEVSGLARDIIEIRTKQRIMSHDIESLWSFLDEEIYDKTVSDIEDSIDNLEKEMKENEVEIKELYKLPRENLMKAVMRIGSEIRCPVLPSDIYKCYRKPSNHEKIGNVIVKFNQLTKRNEFLDAYKNFNRATSVIVKVPLTTRNLKLFHKALESIAENRYQFVFHSDGKVYMQKDKWSSVIHIVSEDDIP